VPADDAAAPTPTIQAPRFELVHMSIRCMRALLARDIATAEQEVGAAIPDGFPEHLDDFLATASPSSIKMQRSCAGAAG
jgi:hypothetical protein